jgi:electron transfer flavoprotein beta subunit
MNIIVLVKQVPDTESERKLVPGAGTLDRAAADGLINELDEYAIEEGLRIAEAHGGEVTILTMGPERAAESIRKALSMGADKAVHVLDDGIAGSDALATSALIAAALGVVGFDLVIAGSESTDARTGVVPAMLAERLGVPQLTMASKVGFLMRGWTWWRGRCPRWSAWSRRSTSRGTRRSRGSWRRRRSRCGP